MASAGKILVTREQIVAAGGVKAALDEAHSLAALQIAPRAMTAYEAVGGVPGEEDEVAIMVQVEVRNEQELLEAVGAGAEAVVLVGVAEKEAWRLEKIARGLRGDLKIEIEKPQP